MGRVGVVGINRKKKNSNNNYNDIISIVIGVNYL